MSILFGDHSWPELERIYKDDPLVILPVGMFEEHGRHLPVSCDTDLVWEFCRAAAEEVKEDIPTLLLPPVWTGYHGLSVSKWPGGIRLEQSTLFSLVYDICASLVRNGVKKIAIANGHGQNWAILELVVRKIIDDFSVVPILCFPINMLGAEGRKLKTSPEGSMAGHADELETSLMLEYRESLVHMDQARSDVPTYHSQFIGGDSFPEHPVIGGCYWSTFNVQHSQNGAMGDPTLAARDTGSAYAKLIVKNFTALLREYYAFNDYTF